MQPSKIASPRVHDLLQLDSDSLDPACIGAPFWVRQTLAICPWVVVRRTQAPPGKIAVGVRGSSRSERWGGFISSELLGRVVSPSELLGIARSSAPILRTPPFKALQQLVERWCDLTSPWGPTGSVGFELVTGRQVTTNLSDLDIAIRADATISREQARSLCERTRGLQTKVDVRVETPECAFSLEEYASTSSPILLRYPDNVRFGNDPWTKNSTAVWALHGAGSAARA
jgi:phosphoribosyl-dephospho-CoA transferase